MGTLSIVSTPIGNLGDITFRAVETLRQADAIACEDTRVSAKLLARYDIKKPLLIFHARSPLPSGPSNKTRIQSRPKGARAILQLLSEEKRVALITDAGTPGVSDPGTELVRLVRDTMPDVRIESVPGPSALTAALSIAGVRAHEFIFLGFLPHKKGRQTLFKEIEKEKRAVVFYESPHRIEKTLTALESALAKERKMSVLRELTKLHESVVEGTVEEVANHFLSHPEEVRGEFVVILWPW